MSVRLVRYLRCMVAVILTAAGLLWFTLPEKTAAEQITIGVADGPQGEIMEYVSSLAAQEGIQVKLVMTNDYVWLDEALDTGEIDLNATQNPVFLRRQQQDRSYDFSVLCYTVLQPMGIYTGQLSSQQKIPNGARVSLPQDPLNCSRALHLLEAGGLIRLKNGADMLVTISDITANPLQLSFALMEAEMAARSLPAVDIAVVNAGFARLAGLTADKALFLEQTDSVYTGMIVYRSGTGKRSVFEKIRRIYQSAEVKQFIEAKFNGMIVTAW